MIVECAQLGAEGSWNSSLLFYMQSNMEDAKYVMLFINQHTLLFKDAFKDTKISDVYHILKYIKIKGLFVEWSL
jgi:hypothetical protein